MRFHKTALIVAISLLAVQAMAGSIPEIWGLGTWPQDYPAQIMATPAGAGDPLTNARLDYGVAVDASIHIQLWYYGGSIDGPELPAKLIGFPAEDIWLAAPGLAICPGGTNPAANTDEDGWFTISEPLHTGGSTGSGIGTEALLIYVSGMELNDENGTLIMPALRINSPDINGDGTVSLPDVAIFAGDFNGVYHFRSDFYGDGMLSLPDVARLSASLGQSCP